MGSLKLGSKGSWNCDADQDVKENVHVTSRSNSKSGSRSFSLPRIISQASRGFSTQMQFQTKSNLDAPDRRGYDELARTSYPESMQGDDTNGANPITYEDIHVQRAAACCLATYFDVHEVKRLFEVQEIERLNFKEVFLSPLPQPEEESTRQNLLVAIAVDNDETSVYVAFRGNSNLAEVFSDVCQPSEIKVFQDSPTQCGFHELEEMGSYHKNFCHRLGQLVPRVDGLLEFCKSLVVNSKNSEVQEQISVGMSPRALSRTRLIFCGHSLGGALSHLATVTCLLSIFGDTTDVLKHQSEEPMSITFGAPLVFDQKAARFLDQVIPVHRRFLNFFQAKDPIPFILARATISHQTQEHFQQLKTKHAVSLAETGRFLVDRKLGKFLKDPRMHENGSMSTGESGQSSTGRKKAKRGHSRSLSSSSQIESSVLSLPMSFHNDGSSSQRAVGAAADGKNSRPPVSNSSSGTRKSNINKKVSEGFQSVADAGKEFIRKVTHGGKKAIAKVNFGNKRQLSNLQTDVKKAKLEPTGDHSTASSFVPFGVYKRLSFHRKAQRHIAEEVRPEEIVNHNFKLNKNHIKQHKIATYIYCLVGQGSANRSNQPNEVNIREGPLPRLDKAELILIRCETSEKLKGARIIATGKYLSLALEHKCQVTTFSEKWRLVAADSSSIIFETLRATDCKNVYVSQGELIELARVGHGNRVTSVSVETIFGRNSGDFFPVLLRDLAADSAVIDGLKHAVGKVLVLFDTEGPKGGEAGRKILHYLQRAAKLTGLKESYDMIVQPMKGTVHAKKTMIDKGFIAQICYALCYKPITLVFESEGAERIEHAAQVVRQQPFTFFKGDQGNDELLVNPFIESLKLRTTPLNKNSDGQVTVELDSYDQILSCLHALLVPDKHAATYTEGTQSQEYASFIKTHEKDLYEAMKEFYEEQQVLRKDKLMENWFLGLDERSRDCLRRRLELLYFLTSAFKVAKEQKLLALVGPENAGKSTLANLLGCKSKESTGYTIQTADMKSYRLAPDLLAVEFPGTDAPGSRSSLSTMWEAFAKLPDRCIVVTPFTGDVTEGSQELPRLAAQKLCRDVMLLVNRVDGILKGPPKAKIWKEYTEETMKTLHEKFMQVSEVGGVNLKDVLLCSLEEEDLNESDIAQLKGRGVIFSKEVKKKILEWIRGPNASPLADAVTPPWPASVETYSTRVDQQLGVPETARKYVGGDSSSVDDGASSTKSDPESRPATRPTRHREKFLAEFTERSNLKRGGQTNVDVKGGGSSSSNSKLATQSTGSSKHSNTSKVIQSPADSSKSSGSPKVGVTSPVGSRSSSSPKPATTSSPPESTQSSSIPKLITSTTDNVKSSSSSKPAILASESRMLSNGTEQIKSPADSSNISSSPKLRLSYESSMFSDNGHADHESSSHGNGNDTVHRTSSDFASPSNSLAWRSKQQTDKQISLQHIEDPFGRPTAWESSEERMITEEHRGEDEGHSGDPDISEGQTTPTTSSSSTSTSTGVSRHSKGQSPFAYQVSQRAVMITADQSVQDLDGTSLSKTQKEPAKRTPSKKSNVIPIGAPWKP